MNFLEFNQKFPTEEKVIEYFIKIRYEEVVCHHCGSHKVYRRKDQPKLFTCKHCNNTFSIFKGTIFEDTYTDLRKWFMAIYLITSHKKGIASLQLHKDLHVTQKTAWFILQRIRKCLGFENDNILNNHVEVDETYIGGKNKNRHFDKKVENSQGRSTKDKVPVLGMIERNGKVNVKAVENVTADTLT